MESIAIHRIGLDAVPVNGLKGYYGHTLGAAGIIETILSMKAIDNEVVLPTKGFETSGTTYCLNISNRSRKSDKTTFIKILSGFGGSNAGIAWQKGGAK
jgi:3-oxoacyl-[acyl-carrier-protein] synthase-1